MDAPHIDAPMPGRPQPQPGDTIVALTPEQLTAVEERLETSGNPREVVDAFTAAPTELPGGITVEPISLGHFLLLEKLEHPIVDPGSESSRGDSMSNVDLLTAIFVLTRPAKESRTPLQQGRDAFDEAVDTFADGIALPDLPKLAAAVNRAMRDALATVIPDEKKTETESRPVSAGD